MPSSSTIAQAWALLVQIWATGRMRLVFVQRSRPQIDRRRAIPLRVEAGITLPADVRAILRAVRKGALSLHWLTFFNVKSGRRENNRHAKCAAGAFLTPVAVTDVRRERFFCDAVAKQAAIASAYRRYGKVHSQSSQKPIMQ